MVDMEMPAEEKQIQKAVTALITDRRTRRTLVVSDDSSSSSRRSKLLVLARSLFPPADMIASDDVSDERRICMRTSDPTPVKHFRAAGSSLERSVRADGSGIVCRRIT